MLKYNDFIELVRTQKFSFARVFQVSGEQFAQYPVGKDSGSVDGLVSFFAGIKEKYGNQWKIVCKYNKTSKVDGECVYYAQFSKEDSQAATANTNPSVDPEKLKKEYRDQWEKERKIEELELRSKELVLKTKELEKPLGKAATILNMFLEKLSDSKFVNKRNTVLQGGEMPGSQLIDATEARPKNNNNMGDKNSNDLDMALANFRKVGVSDKFLLELSKRVVANPRLISDVRKLLDINVD